MQFSIVKYRAVTKSSKTIMLLIQYAYNVFITYLKNINESKTGANFKIQKFIYPEILKIKIIADLVTLFGLVALYILYFFNIFATNSFAAEEGESAHDVILKVNQQGTFF